MNAPRVLHIPDRIVLDILMVLEVGLVVVSAALAKQELSRRAALALAMVWRHPGCPPVWVARRALGRQRSGALVGMRGFLLVCVLAILAACLGSGGAEAQNNYGALAYSPSTQAIGWSYDYGSRGAAEDAALVNCRKQANDCVTHWFYNACGALAVGSAGYGMAWGADRRIAEGNAIRSCQRWTMDCEIKQWVCTTR